MDQLATVHLLRLSPSWKVSRRVCGSNCSGKGLGMEKFVKVTLCSPKSDDCGSTRPRDIGLMRQCVSNLAAVAFATLVGTLCGHFALSTDAIASTTVCSDPSRARALYHLEVKVPGGDKPAFAKSMGEFEGVTDMTLSEVQSSDSSGLRDRIMIFQSPQVSVNIEILTQRASDIARITLNRTCITDALEDYRPYWKAFQNFLRSKRLSH